MPIVTNPTAGDVHVNVPLTNFSQKYLLNADQFVSMRAFPNAPVAKQSDQYFEFNRGDFYRDEAEERADGAESAGSGFRLSQDTYFAKVYAFHKDVTDRQRVNQDSPVQLDQSASQFVMHKLMIRRERLFQTTYMALAIWDTDVTGVAGAPAGGQFQFWDEATSDPITDIRTGKRVIQGLTGYRPNKMIIGRQAWDILMDNDSLLSRITGGANNTLPAMVMRQLIAQLFELDDIFVMDGVFNSALADATDPSVEAVSFINTDDALLYYAPNMVSLNEPTAGAQFSWTGLMGNTPAGARIKRFRMEQNEAERIEGQMAFDYKVTGSELGYFFSNAVA